MKNSSDTPSSNWAANGEPDPHGERFNCKRSKLALGHLTDDELANAVFMHNHRELDLQAILAGEPSSIGLLTAAKERIRWLSRRSESRLGSHAKDLYWNDTPHGCLPDSAYEDCEIVGLIHREVVPLERAETYLIRAKFDGVIYDVHTCSSLSEALERQIVLEKLNVQG